MGGGSVGIGGGCKFYLEYLGWSILRDIWDVKGVWSAC
jgi:hypothetical protein